MGSLSDDYWFTESGDGQGWRLGIFSPPRLPGGQRPRLPLSRFECDPLLFFDENCAEFRAPEATHGGYDELNGDELYQLGSRGADLKTGSWQWKMVLFFRRACSSRRQWGMEIRFPPDGKSRLALRSDWGQKYGDAVTINVGFILAAHAPPGGMDGPQFYIRGDKRERGGCCRAAK